MKKLTLEKAKVLSNEETGTDSGIFLLKLKIDNLKSPLIRPGQFARLRSLNGRPFPRPFAIARVNGHVLYFYIKAVGDNSSNTRQFARLEPGVEINISGPHGKGFEPLPGIKRYLLVGGGVGAAELFPIAEELIRNKIPFEFLQGAKTKKGLIFHDHLLDNGVWPDLIHDIWEDDPDQPGQVTDLLEKALAERLPDQAVIACGPKLMLRKVFDLCGARNVTCLVSVAEVMGCGCGVCHGCAIKMIDKTYRQVCDDGPLFDAYQIDWTAFIPKPPVALISRSRKKQPNGPLKTILYGQERRRLILNPAPVMIASGCSDIAADHQAAGAIIFKSTMLEKKIGNPMPRLCELPCGAINSIGLEGGGIKQVIDEYLPILKATGKQGIISIAGRTADEYGLIMKKLEQSGKLGRAVIEVNISCPNDDRAGMSFGVDPHDTFQVMEIVRHHASPNRFIILKPTPNVTDIVVICQAGKQGGADAFTICNTLLGTDIDIETRRFKLGRGFGGLSGPLMLYPALYLISKVYRANLGLPIIGSGGISSGDDALKHLLAGASAIQVGTASFSDSNIVEKINSRFLEYLGENKEAEHIQDIVGMAQQP
ncbi:MAG TPA: hypothetical protein VMC41_04570 [Candidatus Nanoarchaeia archaeon]|nr:hypothetical protein [Candidatus Nanoarchaeia archaeon]